MYIPAVVTAPTLEPVSVVALKEHLRVVGATENSYIETLGKAARQYVEWRTGRTLFQTTYDLAFDRFPLSSLTPLRLSRAAPLLSVTWVKYTDSDGTVTTLSPSAYAVNSAEMPGSILPGYGYTWPIFTPLPAAAVTVRYVAGLSATASPLVYPDEVVSHAIKLLVAAMYENREGEIVPDTPGVQAIALKYGVEALIAHSQVTYGF